MVTKLGLQKLKEQLASLKEELRLTYQKRSEAAAEGDLKENSAYIFAGEKANLLNSQIEDVVMELNNAKIQSSPTQNQTIVFGSKVTIRFETDQREMALTLVGKNDSGQKSDWISEESPLGIAILGKSKNDQVTVNGQLVTILKIEIGDI